MGGISEDVGRLVRKQREAAGLSQDELARQARLHGFRWTRSTLHKIERGDRPLTLEEFLRIPELLKGFSVSAAVRDLTRDARRRRRDEAVVVGVDNLAKLEAGDVERKAAASLNRKAKKLKKAHWEPLVAIDLAILAQRTFSGRTISAERERRLARQKAQGSIEVRRGWITRKLLDELWISAEEEHEGWTPGGKK